MKGRIMRKPSTFIVVSVSIAAALFVGLLTIEQCSQIRLVNLSSRDSQIAVGSCGSQFTMNTDVYCTYHRPVACPTTEATNVPLTCGYCSETHDYVLRRGDCQGVGNTHSGCCLYFGWTTGGPGDEKCVSGLQGTCGTGCSHAGRT